MWESSTREDQKKTSSKAKPLRRRWLKLEDLIIQAILKLVVVENEWRLLFFPYQLFTNHPENVPVMD